MSFKLQPSLARSDDGVRGVVPFPEGHEEGVASDGESSSTEGEESDYVEIVQWECRLPNATRTWDYFRHEAPTIARQHHVAPEDLILSTHRTFLGTYRYSTDIPIEVVDTGGEIRSDCSRVTTQSTPPGQDVYLYLHFEPSSPAPRAYWSFAEVPGILDASFPALDDLQGPDGIS